jgi:hypothetical protein
MAPTRLDITPEDLEQGGDYGFALLSGRMVAGVVSDPAKGGSGEQITVRATCKIPPLDGGRWTIAPFDELHRRGTGRVYLDVPYYDSDQAADEIGIYDPATWTFTPARRADPARVWAALYALLMACGRQPVLLLGAGAQKAKIHPAGRCIRCGKEIWLEESVTNGMGRTCHGLAQTTVHQQRAQRGSAIGAPTRPPRRRAASEDVVAADFDIGLREF